MNKEIPDAWELLSESIDEGEEQIDKLGHDEIEKAFTYHKPHDDQQERYKIIRDKAKQLAYHIYHMTPDSVERTKSLIRLREAVMWANAAIAIRESKDG